MAEPKSMSTYVDLCCSLSVPLWVAPLLHSASRLKTDLARRRKVYRLIQRQLMHHKVGCSEFAKPTYVYPSELKKLIRTAFPEQICDYNDPHHGNVFNVTMDDLNGLNSSDQD